MRTVDIVGVAPVGIENLGLQDAVEDLAGEELIAGPAVEAFDVRVLPGRAGVDEGGLGTSLPTPVLERRSDELRPVEFLTVVKGSPGAHAGVGASAVPERWATPSLGSRPYSSAPCAPADRSSRTRSSARSSGDAASDGVSVMDRD